MSDYKLLPCPFCGGRAEYKEKPVPMVICQKCQAQIRGAKFRLIPRNYEIYLEGLWNTRAQLSRQKGE